MSANFIFIFLLYLLHVVCLSQLCSIRFKIKKMALLLSGIVLPFSLLVFVLMKTLPMTTGAYVSIIVTIIPGVAATFFMSSYSISKTLFLFLSYIQFFWVLLFVSGLLSNLFFQGEWIPAAIIRTVLHIGVAFLCAAFRNPFTAMSQRIPKGWWPLDLVAVLFTVYLGYLAPRIYAPEIAASAPVSFVMLFTIIITVYVVFFYTIGYMNEAARTKQAELQSTFLLSQIEAMQEAVETAGRTRHDMRHHNLLIVQYAEKGQMNELLHYLGEYEKESDSHAQPAYCENLAANNILSAYVRKAKKHGIEVRLDTDLEQNIAIHDMDLVVILANLMENAIHGCIHSGKPDPFIELYIGRKAAKLVIYAKNTAGDDIVFENGIPVSANGEGIGISSILHSAAGYGGEYDFGVEKGVFFCQFLLKTSKTVVK